MSLSGKERRITTGAIFGKGFTPPPKPAPAPARAGRDALSTMPTFRTRPGGPGLELLGGLGKRLRNVDSRDMSLIAAGLSMLLMGPIVSHLVSHETDTAQLASGFDHKGFSFGDAAEALAGALPSGDLEGTITALQARDPSALIVVDREDRGERLQPLSRSRAVPGRPAARSGWQDAISSAARSGATAASRQAHLPTSGSRLAGKLNAMSSGGLRGGGGSGGNMSLALPPPSSRELTHAAPPRSSLSRVEPTADYRGAGARSPAMGTGGGAGFFSEGRKLALNGAGILSSGGSDGGGGGPGNMAGVSRGGGSGASGGRPMQDDHGKSFGVSSTQDSRNVSINQKEDLNYERRKMEMQKSIDLKYAKKQYDQIERKKMLEQIAAQTASQALLKVLDKGLDLLIQAAQGAGGEKKKKDQGDDSQGGGGG